MDLELKAIVEELMKQGIRVAVDPSGLYADAYELTLKNGDRYDCLKAGLFKLRDEKSLNEEGIRRAATKK